MLAVGFTLIFGVARILNLAHGSFYALGAYGTYVLTTFGLPLVPAALVAIAFVALFGVAMERVLVRPMRHKSLLAVLMITLAVAPAIDQVLFLTFGSEYRNVPTMVTAKYTILSVRIAGQRRYTAISAILLIDT